jgi:CreA protein
MKKFVMGALSVLSFAVSAEEIGSVDTSFRMLGPDNKIVVESLEDPAIHGVTCYLAHAKTGGFSGAVGVAEDKTEVSISCLKTGVVTITDVLTKQEDIAKFSASVLFKKIHVVRILDATHGVATYLTYSDKIIEGSPKNSLSSVKLDIPIHIK